VLQLLHTVLNHIVLHTFGLIFVVDFKIFVFR